MVKRRLNIIEATSYIEEKAILVGLAADIQPESERSSADSLDELEALLATAGGRACGRLFQHLHAPNSRSFIGRGKVEELKLLLQEKDCRLAVFDNELTPSQTRALSAELEVRVLDRSGLILDIFAQRAQSREGRLQVELAQYKYLLPRLTGLWSHLDRETSAGAGPIGSRGTGETQLESDRRIIRRKIDRLERELEQVRRDRATQRSRRRKNQLPLAALVGYTNAGKSSLLNRLTGADVPAQDRLFDTLDATTRRLRLTPGHTLLLSDTVGFIRKLPHHLVEAFQATLEELSYADLILHVVDLSSPEWERQALVTDRLIDQLARPAAPRLLLYNKADKVAPADLPLGGEGLVISARSGQGLEELKQKMAALLGLEWPQPSGEPEAGGEDGAL